MNIFINKKGKTIENPVTEGKKVTITIDGVAKTISTKSFENSWVPADSEKGLQWAEEAKPKAAEDFSSTIAKIVKKDEYSLTPSGQEVHTLHFDFAGVVYEYLSFIKVAYNGFSRTLCHVVGERNNNFNNIGIKNVIKTLAGGGELSEENVVIAKALLQARRTAVALGKDKFSAKDIAKAKESFAKAKDDKKQKELVEAKAKKAKAKEDAKAHVGKD